MKSTVEEIRTRFDHDVERFSNLGTGQEATMDAPLVMDLATRTAAAVTPGARSVLDIGCGAGNYTLKLLVALAASDVDCTLLDLSRPMLERAASRVGEATTGRVATLQGDVREAELGVAAYDVVMAAAVLHHLRTDAEWEAVFRKVARALRPGGSFWVADLVTHEDPAVHAVQWERYGDYLVGLRGEAYRDAVFAYIEKEDTPRPVTYQLELLRRVGFERVDLLHKNGPFAAFGGVWRG